MSKLNISNNTNAISFISLDKNDKFLSSNISYDNSTLKICGENPINLSFNSKNSIFGKRDITNTFEFSNNDYFDKNDVAIIKKDIKDSNNVVLILDKGVNLYNGNDTISVINSNNIEIVNSEIVTLFNARNSKIYNSENVFGLGESININDSKNAIIIGKNVNLKNTTNNVVIGFNVNSNNSDQLLIGDFSGVSTKGMSIAISHKNNTLYTNNENDKFHIGSKLIFGHNIYLDRIEINEEEDCNLILCNNFIEQSNSFTKNIILGDTNMINSASNVVMAGYKNKDKSSSNNTILGSSNSLESVNNATILGENNDTKQLSYILLFGNSNKLNSMNSNIIFGSNNNSMSNSGNVLFGSFNDISSYNYSIISGSHNTLSSFSGTIIIGEEFNRNRTKATNVSYSYIISDKNNTLVLNDSWINIDKYPPVTYRKYIEDCKHFNDYIAQYKFSLVSIDKTHKLVRDNGTKNIYLKMKLGGFYNIYYKQDDSSEQYIKIFINDKSEVAYSSDKSTLGINWAYIDEESCYYIRINYSYKHVTTESSLCEELDNITYNLDKTANRVGFHLLNSESNIINANNLHINVFNVTDDNSLYKITTNNLYIDENINLTSSPFSFIKSDVYMYNVYMSYAKAAEECLLDNDPEEATFNHDFMFYHFNVSGVVSKTFENFDNRFWRYFYTNIPSMQYFRIFNEPFADRQVTTILFKIKIDNTEKLISYFDLQRVGFINNRYWSNKFVPYDWSPFGMSAPNGYFEKATVHTYLNGYNSTRFGRRKHNPDPLVVDARNANAKLFGENEELYDSIVRLRDSDGFDGHGSDFLTNYDTATVVKWGLYANVRFQPIQHIGNKGDITKEFKGEMFKYMYISSRTTSDRPVENVYIFNNKYDVDYNIDSEYYGDTDNITYRQEIYTGDDSTNNHNYENVDVYLPLVTKGNYMADTTVQKIGGKIIRGFHQSLEPRNKNFTIIKCIHIFNTPLNMMVKYNYGDFTLGKYVTNELGITRFVEIREPLFYGKLSFNKLIEKESGEIRDYGTFNSHICNKSFFGPYSESHLKLSSDYKKLYNGFRYVNEMIRDSKKTNDYRFNVAKASEIDSIINVTYALKHISNVEIV